jgi:uncharacterized protein
MAALARRCASSIAGRLAVIGRSAEDVLPDYISVVQILDAPSLAQPVCRDPDDDAVLALGVAAQAELIVSGDKDFLVLGQYEGNSHRHGARGHRST